MPHKTKVAEIMVSLTDYPHMPYWFSLRQAISMLRLAGAEDKHPKRPPRVVLVFDEKYQLMGMLRKRDILKGLEPKALSEWPPEAWPRLSTDQLCTLWSDLKASKEAANAEAKKLMMPVKTTVKTEDSITLAACRMIQEDVPALAVMDGNKVAGIVAFEDVYDAITEAVMAA